VHIRGTVVRLRDQGLVSAGEYEAKKVEILAEV
jgi:hypothetical protein